MRAAASRPSGEWNDDDFDVLADGAVVGRIFNAAASPVGTPWMWSLTFGHHEDRTATHGYAATREAAMAAFAKSWRRGMMSADLPLALAVGGHEFPNHFSVTHGWSAFGGPTMVGRTLDWKGELGRWLKPFLDRAGAQGGAT